MLNLSDALTRIKMDIGIYGMVLPFENGDQALVDVIKFKTIPVYSKYSPYRLEVRLRFEDLKEIDRMAQGITYIIPNDLVGGRTIITIEKIEPYYAASGNISYGSSISYCDVKDMMLGTQNNSLAHYIRPKRSFDFKEPNKVTLYNFPRGDLLATIGFAHEYNLSTIDEGHTESFMELALLDVKNFLFQSMRNYDEIQTAYGTYKLRTDEWSGAQDQRKDLIEKWNATYHLDSTMLYYIS